MRLPGRPLLHDAARYALCGAAAGGADYATFLLLHHRAGWAVVAAQAVSRPVGGLVSFAANRLWTFRGRTRHRLHVQFTRYGVVWTLSYGLSLLAIAGFARLLPGHGLLAKVTADAAVGLLTFLAQRHWTFR